jgi:hypothetical protein
VCLTSLYLSLTMIPVTEFRAHWVYLKCSHLKILNLITCARPFFQIRSRSWREHGVGSRACISWSSLGSPLHWDCLKLPGYYPPPQAKIKQ